MDTRKYHKGQLVYSDDNLNEQLGPAGTVETAMDNLHVDDGTDGIVDGLVATEVGTPDMTVDISTGAAYDGEGKRAKVSAGQNVDLSALSIPAAGNEKWVSIFIENTKTNAEATVDDDGAGDYWEYNDSFTISYTEGTEAVIPATKPAVGLAKKRLICDVRFYNGQTTITNTEINTDRREQSRWPNEVAIDASSWTELETTSETVQEVMDDIDSKIIDPAAIDVDLIPDAGARDLGSATNRWTEFHGDTIEVYTKIQMGNATVDIGDATDPLDELYVNKIYLDTIGTPAIDFETAQSGDRTQPLSSATVMDSDNWNYTNATGYQVWESAATAARQYLVCSGIFPHGVEITSFDVVWEQASSTTNNMQVTLYRIARNTGQRSSQGNIIIGTFGSQQDDNANITDFTVDNGSFEYIFEIASSDATAAICKIYSIRANWSITNVLKTVLG